MTVRKQPDAPAGQLLLTGTTRGCGCGEVAMTSVEATEIEDVETWNAVVTKDNENLNIIDVYAKWCGPCMCE